MAKFSPGEWKKINSLLDREEKKFGLPARRAGSVVLASFNIRKLGKLKNKSKGAWDFLERFCSRCDLIAVQEVLDSLEGLNHLKERLGYGLVASDITGGVPGAQGMAERLAYLYHWETVERTEVASDITYDRKAVLDTLYDNREGFHAAFKEHAAKLKRHRAKLAAYAARGRRGSRPKTPQYVMPHFVTFIRTPLCVSFRIVPKRGSKPIEFLAVNAHLLFGNASKHRQEREMEFKALISWLVYRARQAARMYHKNMLLLGDLNLDFKKSDKRRTQLETWLKSLNRAEGLSRRGRASVNFPFFDVHPDKNIPPNKPEVFRSTARQKDTYDQIAFFKYDPRLPGDRQNERAGKVRDGFDYGVFNFSDLFAEALHGKPLADLSKSQRSNLFRKFEHDLSDHMPIWVRLPKP